ncbi:hypothetical protein DPEC_G00121870 [Dallia pectoralis]|uniref:Uncharacterized protein n=1 Tax=Dallia pectoralis TaxID=75939 RepID=A0ACC2GQC2_DALPE|nr:hypothetical protein DPEC_G00121870 [Dallia pectoralis]
MLPGYFRAIRTFSVFPVEFPSRACAETGASQIRFGCHPRLISKHLRQAVSTWKLEKCGRLEFSCDDVQRYVHHIGSGYAPRVTSVSCVANPSCQQTGSADEGREPQFQSLGRLALTCALHVVTPYKDTHPSTQELDVRKSLLEGSISKYRHLG